MARLSVRALIVAALVPTLSLAAQVSPAGRWQTLTTPHFRVHFRVGADAIAFHAAAEGERAYQLLATELVPPRSAVDLVLSDAADFANGSASVFPTKGQPSSPGICASASLEGRAS